MRARMRELWLLVLEPAMSRAHAAHKIDPQNLPVRRLRRQDRRRNDIRNEGEVMRPGSFTWASVLPPQSPFIHARTVPFF